MLSARLENIFYINYQKKRKCFIPGTDNNNNNNGKGNILKIKIIKQERCIEIYVDENCIR